MSNPKAEGLTKKEKEAVGLLSIGTFLEYFDLMLYVHMAVLLNELFFPQTDPLTSQLITAFTFSSSYILRPLGGIVIGWVGDKIGRKATIIITTTIMASCCFIMAILPTYAEIGFTASIIMIVCRMAQGFSSLGESVGAEIYISETLKSPHQYSCNQFLSTCMKAGGLLALGVASLVLSINFNWRLAFFFGLVIALIGFVARTRLRETPEFINYRLNAVNSRNNFFDKVLNKKMILTSFLLYAVFPVGFYSAYIYSGTFMKERLGFTAEQVINQNFKVTFAITLLTLVVMKLVKKYHPIKVAKATLLGFIVFLPFIPTCFYNISNTFPLLLLQIALFSLALNTSGTLGTVCFKHYPINKRFRAVAIIFGLSSPISVVATSFALIPLTNYFGYYGLLVLFIPIIIAYYWAINYLKTLEIKKGLYNHYPYKDEDVEDDVYAYNYKLGEKYKPYQKECKYSKRLIDMLESLNKTAKKKVNIKLVKKAITFGKKWHDGQKRKTGEPYYTHPLAVAMMTAEYKFKTHMIVAAILHDVVEDSDCTVELIAKEFTPRIAEIVGLLTREYENKKLTVAESIKKIFDATDYEALLIKGLDRIHNLQTIGGMKSKKQKEIAEETIYEIASVAAYAVDDLNINDKRKLERKLYKLSNRALKKARNSQ